MSVNSAERSLAVHPEQSDGQMQNFRGVSTCRKVRLFALGTIFAGGAIALSIGLPKLFKTLSTTELRMSGEIQFDPITFAVKSEEANARLEMEETSAAIASIVAGTFASLFSLGGLFEMACDSVFRPQ